MDYNHYYVRIVYRSPMGREMEEVSHLMPAGEAAMTAKTMLAAKHSNIRHDILHVCVEKLAPVV